MLDDVIYAVL